MSWNARWGASALLLACGAGVSLAAGPEWATVTFDPPAAAASPAPAPAAELAAPSPYPPTELKPRAVAGRSCGCTTACCPQEPGYVRSPLDCGKHQFVPCLPERYGYHETCWRPWKFPPECPRCETPEAVPVNALPPAAEPMTSAHAKK